MCECYKGCGNKLMTYFKYYIVQLTYIVYSDIETCEPGIV